MPIDIDAVPIEIQQTKRAVVWKYEKRGSKHTKVPYRPDRPALRAAVDDPTSWGAFSTAVVVAQRGLADGPGVVLGAGLVGVDLDHCRDIRTGLIATEAKAIIATLDSYTELSPSGAGVHVLVRGVLPPGGRRRGRVEVYDEARYFTVTGWHLPGTPADIRERTAALADLHERLFTTRRSSSPPSLRRRLLASLDDERALLFARNARNGAKFTALWLGDTSGYPSASEADLALCNLLVFWTKGDPEVVDRLFRRSGLYRPKWDERHGTMTYGDWTIAKALAGYVPRAP